MQYSKNYSPWIHQLERKRVAVQLQENKETDIAIVGAGIAGVMTAYKLLKETDKNVIVVDSNLAGHGATGHNAGQLTTYFERPLADIAREFGVEMTCRGQMAIESSWDEIGSLYEDLNLKTPLYTCTGHAGMTELKQVLLHLADNMIRCDGGIPIERMIISETCQYLKDIPAIYSHLYEVASQQVILNLLETNNKDYIATLAYKKGVANSAKLCEEVIEKLLERYKDRFYLYEYTPVNKIILDKHDVTIEIVFNKNEMLEDKTLSADYVIRSHRVILCTNGFEGFTIVNLHGENIDSRFHHEVSGRVNYMVAYLDTRYEDPVAISYFPKEHIIVADNTTVTGEQYFYLTRRPHLHEGKEVGLISIGGPERILKEGEMYNRSAFCESWATEDIDRFLKSNYSKHNHKILEYDFCWHGLLGYTTSGIRLIGEEPLNTRLLYNLGCNGIGLMPSIYGAKRIAQIVTGMDILPSIFDPKEQ